MGVVGGEGVDVMGGDGVEVVVGVEVATADVIGIVGVAGGVAGVDGACVAACVAAACAEIELSRVALVPLRANTSDVLQCVAVCNGLQCIVVCVALCLGFCSVCCTVICRVYCTVASGTAETAAAIACTATATAAGFPVRSKHIRSVAVCCSTLQCELQCGLLIQPVPEKMRFEIVIGMQPKSKPESRNYHSRSLFKFSNENRPRTIVS